MKHQNKYERPQIPTERQSGVQSLRPHEMQAIVDEVIWRDHRRSLCNHGPDTSGTDDQTGTGARCLSCGRWL